MVLRAVYCPSGGQIIPHLFYQKSSPAPSTGTQEILGGWLRSVSSSIHGVNVASIMCSPYLCCSGGCCAPRNSRALSHQYRPRDISTLLSKGAAHRGIPRNRIKPGQFCNSFSTKNPLPLYNIMFSKVILSATAATALFAGAATAICSGYDFGITELDNKNCKQFSPDLGRRINTYSRECGRWLL